MLNHTKHQGITLNQIKSFHYTFIYTYVRYTNKIYTLLMYNVDNMVFIKCSRGIMPRNFFSFSYFSSSIPYSRHCVINCLNIDDVSQIVKNIFLMESFIYILSSNPRFRSRKKRFLSSDLLAIYMQY